MDEVDATEPRANRLSNVPTARELGYEDGELTAVDLRDVVVLGDESCLFLTGAWLSASVGSFVSDVEQFR